jgi:hypothetical protein
VIKLFKGVHRSGLTRAESLKAALPGVVATEPFSHSEVGRVARYIANQEEHHRKQTYSEEYKTFVKRYGLEWRAEENH